METSESALRVSDIDTLLKMQLGASCSQDIPQSYSCPRTRSPSLSLWVRAARVAAEEGCQYSETAIDRPIRLSERSGKSLLLRDGNACPKDSILHEAS